MVVDRIPYTLKIRSGCEGGGKGALIQSDLSATLATNNDQYLFQPMAYSFDSLASNSMKSSNPHSGCRQVEVAKTLDTTDPNPSKNQGGIAIVEPTAIFNEAYQHHGWRETDTAGTLTAGQNGTVRGDTPLVCVPVMCKTYDARGNGDGEVVSTHTGDHENRITDYTSVVCEPIPIHDQATRFAGKRGDKADGKGNGLGVGHPGEPMNTLTSADRHAVAYCMGNGQLNQMSMSEVCNTLDCMHDKQAILYQETVGALCARDYKGVGSQYVEEDKLVIAPEYRYIVRRLTPTECARLQGFPDKWGHPGHKDDFADDEYKFWLNVRNTHASINGKAVKQYTKEQMLKWYNGLHTDSAEYKMWGNGIALPPALYCMQGMAEELERI